MNVQIQVLFQGLKKSSRIRPELEPGQYFTSMINLHPDLKLAGSYPVEVRVYFHDRNGYPFSTLSLTIKARGKQKISFALENFSALPGSVYAVLSFLEYEADGRHFSVITESKVNVITGKNIFKERRWLFLTLGLILGAVAILSQFLKRTRAVER